MQITLHAPPRFLIPVLLGIGAASGLCFIIAGALDIRQQKQPGKGMASLTGGSLLLAAAVVVFLITRQSADLPDWGEVDPAAPMVSDLMNEIRSFENGVIL